MPPQKKKSPTPHERLLSYDADRTTIEPAASASDSAAYERVLMRTGAAPTSLNLMPGISGENVATADTTKISRSKGSVAADVLEAVSPQANAA